METRKRHLHVKKKNQVCIMQGDESPNTNIDSKKMFKNKKLRRFDSA